MKAPTATQTDEQIKDRPRHISSLRQPGDMESKGERAHTPGYNAPWKWDEGRPEHYDLTWLIDSKGERVLTLYGGNESNKKAIPTRRIRKLLAAAPETAAERDKLREQLSLLIRTVNDTLRHGLTVGQEDALTDCVKSANEVLDGGK